MRTRRIYDNDDTPGMCVLMDRIWPRVMLHEAIEERCES